MQQFSTIWKKMERDDRYVRSNANLIQHRTDRGLQLSRITNATYVQYCTTIFVFHLSYNTHKFHVINENFDVKIHTFIRTETYWNFEKRGSRLITLKPEFWNFLERNRYAILVIIFRWRNEKKNSTIMKLNNEKERSWINA